MAKKNGNKKGGKAEGKAAAKKPQGAKESPKKEGSLASIIDPYLIGGGHTTQEVATELEKKVGDKTRDRVLLEANVRARLVSFKRKGWSVVKDAEKRVKVVPAAKA